MSAHKLSDCKQQSFIISHGSYVLGIWEILNRVVLAWESLLICSQMVVENWGCLEGFFSHMSGTWAGMIKISAD